MGCGKIKKIVNPDAINWVIKSFKPFKSPVKAGIFPALLQKDVNVLLSHLAGIFRVSIAIAIHNLYSWREAKTIFIPKTGISPCDEPTSYMPINLMFFMLKSTEKVI